MLRRFERLAAVLNLHANGRIIGTTGEHPFHVVGEGWVPAKELRIGDRITTRDGQTVAVEGLADSGQVTTVYNLEIEEDHTYFVGCAEWGWSVWAHNTQQCEEILVAGKAVSTIEVMKAADEAGGQLLAQAKASLATNPIPVIPAGEATPYLTFDIRGRVEPGTLAVTIRSQHAFLTAQTEAGGLVGHILAQEHRASPLFEAGIAGIGAPANMKGPYYPALAKQLAGTHVGDLLSRILGNRDLPNTLTHTEQTAVGALAGLMFGFEPSHPKFTMRHQRDLVHSYLLAELMSPERGNAALTIGDMLNHYFPAAGDKVQIATQQITKVIRGERATMLPMDGSSQAATRRAERFGRESRTLETWFDYQATQNHMTPGSSLTTFMLERIAAFNAHIRGPG